MSKKAGLEDIRKQQYFDIPTLAQQAGVDISVIHRMLSRQPVQRYQAELVLVTLSDEHNANYTLDTIDILLVPEGEVK